MSLIHIKILHAKKPTFTELETVPKDLMAEFTVVGEHVSADTDTNVAMNKAFDATQNLEEPWKEGVRSTSVGDIFLVTEDDADTTQIYSVDNVGFSLKGNYNA